MTEVLECVYEGGVFKPIGKVVELREGERVKIMIEKKIDFEPIKLKKPVKIEKIREIRTEFWTSSWILLNYMNTVFESIEIVHDTKDLKLIENVAKTCHLMPNDAVIAATCKFYGIKKLATFDNDFNRVDFLESVRAG